MLEGYVTKVWVKRAALAVTKKALKRIHDNTDEQEAGHQANHRVPEL